MAGFSSSMRQKERELRLRGAIRYSTGAEYALEPGDFVSARISEGVDTGILPGAVISAACTLIMNNVSGQFEPGGALRGQADMTGAELTLEIEVKNDAGEWLYAPMGVYYVDDMVSEVNSAVVTLECHDGICHRTGVEFRDELVYPCLLGDVFESAAEQAGFAYDGLLPGDGLILDRKPDWKGATVREVMGYVAAIMGCCVLADRRGCLDMRPLAGERTPFVIYPEQYMARTYRDGYFGPVTRLNATTVNGEGDGESETETMEFSVGGVECALEVAANPLLVTGAAHAGALGQAMMDAVAGLEYARCEFSWRGDPDLMPGRYLKLVGVDGGETLCTISRQTLVFDGGFFAECVCGVPGDGEIRQNALGWSGQVSAQSIVGVIPAANIGAGSITAVKIAAGAVNADRIAADAVTAEKISAQAVTAEKISAGAVTAEKIGAGAVTADRIAANAITADKLSAGAVTAEKIASKSITAEQIAAGTITAESGIIADSAIGTAQIADGSITSAKVVELSADVIKAGTLSAERLVIVGEDGIIYRLNAASSGLSLTELSQDQYRNYINGTVIVAKSITAAQIAAKTITGNEILAGSITAQEIDVSDLFAAEATIQALNAMDITGNTYLRLMVADAVDSVQVGGTQLLRDTQKFTAGSDADHWRFDSGASTYADASGFDRIMLTSTGATVDTWIVAESPLTPLPGGWQGRQATLSAWINSGDWAAVDGGMAWTLSLSQGGTNRLNYGDKYNIVKPGEVALGADAVGNRALANNVWVRVSTTFTLDSTDISGGNGTLSDNTHIFAQFHLRRNGDVRIYGPKLEFGNRATEWSQYPDEFRAGSAITLTKDEVRISTPEFNVEILGDDGETNMLSIDEDGAQMQSLTAPDVTPRYKGPATLYVNPSATAAQIAAGNYYRSLADALAALSNKWISKNVAVNLAAGMTEYGTATLRGCCGGGWITIRGDSTNRAKLVGKLQILYCTNPTTVQYLNVDAPVNAQGIDVSGGYCDIAYCTVTGKGTGSEADGATNTSSFGILAREGARVTVRTCELYDTYRSLYAQTAAQMSANGNKGNCLIGANRTNIFVTGTAPSNDPSVWNYSEVGGKVWGSGVTVDQGSKPTPETAPTTVTVGASATDSYYSASGAWINQDNVIRQGYYSGMGEWAGCMWFPTTSFSGKTVKSASLTLTRTSGSGRSSDVTLTLYGITLSSASGNPHTGKVSYGALGTIGNGETKTFTLPLAAAQALAGGTIKGFMLYANDGAVMSGRSYSYNYCKITSTLSSAGVLGLSVTYS